MEKNILITAPSLDTRHNVSGISTMVRTIIEHNPTLTYHHFLFGRKDKNSGNISSILLMIKQLLLFPFALKKDKIDLVHQNFPFDPKGELRESVVGLWCRLYKIPVVLHVHGGIFLTNKTVNPFYRFLAKKIFWGSSAVIVLSNIEKRLLANDYEYRHTFVLSNCIDSSFSSRLIDRQLKLVPVFLYMGRLDEAKGLYDMAEAFRLLKDDGIKFRFNLCGDGPLKSIIPVFETLLEEDFTFHGVVWGETKEEIVEASDFFLLPSWFEGLPVSLLETMAAGTVPLITDVGSVNQYVIDGITGIIVDKKNPLDLYRKIKKIINEPDLYKMLSVNARRKIAESCNINDYIAQLNHIYEQCLPSKK